MGMKTSEPIVILNLTRLKRFISLSLVTLSTMTLVVKLIQLLIQGLEISQSQNKKQGLEVCASTATFCGGRIVGENNLSKLFQPFCY